MHLIFSYTIMYHSQEPFLKNKYSHLDTLVHNTSTFWKVGFMMFTLLHRYFHYRIRVCFHPIASTTVLLNSFYILLQIKTPNMTGAWNKRLKNIIFIFPNLKLWVSAKTPTSPAKLITYIIRLRTLIESLRFVVNIGVTDQISQLSTCVFSNLQGKSTANYRHKSMQPFSLRACSSSSSKSAI